MLTTLSLALFVHTAHAGAFADTPTWVAGLDPDAPELYDGAVWSSGPTSKLEAADFVMPDGKIASVDLAAMAASLSASLRDRVDAAYLAGALRSAPVYRDSYAEFDDRVILHLVTEVDVLQPARFADYVPETKGTFYPGATPSSADLAQFQALVGRNDPYLSTRDDLRQAHLKKDGRLLFSAGMDGVGKVRHVRDIVLYKFEPEGLDVDFPDSAATGAEAIVEAAARVGAVSPGPGTSAKGSMSNRKTWVFGWQYDLNHEWGDRWEYWFGFARVSAGVVVRAGVRLPYDLQTTMSPLQLSGPDAVPVELTAAIAPRDLDAEGFEDAGLPGWSGDEVSVVARAWVAGKIYALGVDWVHIEAPDRRDRSRGGEATWDLVNLGASFQAPFGADEVDRRFEFPMEQTGVKVDIPFFSVGVDLGLRVAARAEELDYHLGLVELTDDEANRTFRPRHRTTAMRRFDLVQKSLPSTGTLAWGYVLDDPELTLDLHVRPGLRLRAVLELSDINGWFSDLPLTTDWLEPVEFRLGEATFSALDETDPRRELVWGTRER